MRSRPVPATTMTCKPGPATRKTANDVRNGCGGSASPPGRRPAPPCRPAEPLDSAKTVLYKAPPSRPRPAQVAQSVEQRTENPRVGGSIPPLGTIHFNRLAGMTPAALVPLGCRLRHRSVRVAGATSARPARAIRSQSPGAAPRWGCGARTASSREGRPRQRAVRTQPFANGDPPSCVCVPTRGCPLPPRS